MPKFNLMDATDAALKAICETHGHDFAATLYRSQAFALGTGGTVTFWYREKNHVEREIRYWVLRFTEEDEWLAYERPPVTLDHTVVLLSLFNEFIVKLNGPGYRTSGSAGRLELGKVYLEGATVSLGILYRTAPTATNVFSPETHTHCLFTKRSGAWRLSKVEVYQQADRAADSSSRKIERTYDDVAIQDILTH